MYCGSANVPPRELGNNEEVPSWRTGDIVDKQSDAVCLSGWCHRVSKYPRRSPPHIRVIVVPLSWQ